MLKFEVPEGLPTWTFEDVQKGTGIEGAPFYMALNGKVLQRTRNLEGAITRFAGKHVDLFMVKLLYEPKFGDPSSKTKLSDFCQEHRDFLEHTLYSFNKKENPYDVVALIKE